MNQGSKQKRGQRTEGGHSLDLVPPVLSLWSSLHLRTGTHSLVTSSSGRAEQVAVASRAPGAARLSCEWIWTSGAELLLQVLPRLWTLPSRAREAASYSPGGESETRFDDKEPSVRLQGLLPQERKAIHSCGKSLTGLKGLSFPHSPEGFTVLGGRHGAVRCLRHFPVTDGWLPQLDGAMETA